MGREVKVRTKVAAHLERLSQRDTLVCVGVDLDQVQWEAGAGCVGLSGEGFDDGGELVAGSTPAVDKIGVSGRESTLELGLDEGG
jgi:hypothetical protein